MNTHAVTVTWLSGKTHEYRAVGVATQGGFYAIELSSGKIELIPTCCVKSVEENKNA